MLETAEDYSFKKAGLSLAVIVILAAAFTLHALAYWDWTEDDAYITFRYAENLAEGQGLVFNSGERVEGYSNFLWLIMTAGGMKAGIDPVPLSKTAGLISGLAALLLSWMLARRVCRPGSMVPLFAPLYMAAAPFVTRHSVSGLETCMFAALTAGAVLAAAGGRGRRRQAILTVLLIALSLTRVEGPVVAILILAGRVLFSDEDNIRESLRETFLFELLPYILVFGIYYLWRWNYFNDPFANTYYAKIHYGPAAVLRGGRYTAEFIRDAGGAVFIGLAAVPFLFRNCGKTFRFSALVIVFYTGFIILSGGDWMFFYRFYAHIIPILIPMIAAGASCILMIAASRGTGVGALRILAGGVMIAVFLVTAAAERRIANLVLPAVRNHNYLSQNYMELAGWFKDNTDPDVTVAISDVGAFSYYSDRRVLDLFELVTRNFKRASDHPGCATVSDYILAREPEYIVLMVKDPSNGETVLIRPYDSQMYHNPEFRRNYTLLHRIPQHWNHETARIYRIKKAGQ